jgi:hypothetical protein
VCKPIHFDDFTDAIEQLGAYWLTVNRSASVADDLTTAGNF